MVKSRLQYRSCRTLRFDPWVGKIHWSREMAPYSNILAWEIPERGAWRAIVHGVAELDAT